jgi:hypothetical protein
MVFYVSEGSPDTVLSDARIGQLLHQVSPTLPHARPLIFCAHYVYVFCFSPRGHECG